MKVPNLLKIESDPIDYLDRYYLPEVLCDVLKRVFEIITDSESGTTSTAKM